MQYNIKVMLQMNLGGIRMNKFKESLKVETGEMKDIPVYSNKISEKAIDRVVDMLTKQNAKLLENDNIEPKEKFDQAIIYFQFLKILADYDQVIPVLDKFARDKQKKMKRENDEKFEEYLEKSFEKEEI